MAKSRRFVLARRRTGSKSGRDRAPETEVDWTRVLRVLGPSVMLVNEPYGPDGRPVRYLVFEAKTGTVLKLLGRLPRDILLEPEIPHYPLHGFPWPFGGGKGKTLTVRAVCGKRPIPGAIVSIIPRDGIRREPIEELLTDEAGEVTFAVKPSEIEHVVVAPLTGYWAVKVDRPASRVTVNCPPLEIPERGLGWWHHELGIDVLEPSLGAGVRIGIVDTGLGRHRALEHVQHLGIWEDGGYFPDRRPQGGLTFHGTHVCGILSARPVNGRGFWGVAPGAEVFVASCYGGESHATASDIANAIVTMAERYEVDLINLSQGSYFRSQILLDAIQQAADMGCLCVCAAGNTRGVVMWPARSHGTVSVSAVGLRGACPETVYSAQLLDPAMRAGNGLFLATFSRYGGKVDCCAPGVAVISTVPEVPGLTGDFWASHNGTSMAAPAACGALAVRLSRSRRYRNSERDRERVRMARNMLYRSCRPTELDPMYQGKGIPSVRPR